MQIDLALPRFERKFLKLAAHATITVLALATHAVSIAAPPADVCASAATQAAMSLCAQEDFEEAGSGYAQAIKRCPSLCLPRNATGCAACKAHGSNFAPKRAVLKVARLLAAALKGLSTGAVPPA